MKGGSLCTASLFVADGAKNKATATQILKQFDLGDQEFDANHWRFDILGASFPDIRDKLVKALAGYLDPRKRSCLSYIGKDGVYTILVKDGEVLCS